MSLAAVLIGWIVIIPPLISVYNYRHRIKRAEEINGVPHDEQIKPLLAFLLYFPGGILVIPTLFHYWYVTKHQDRAVMAAAAR